jgi:cytochrome c peroxidase
MPKLMLSLLLLCLALPPMVQSNAGETAKEQLDWMLSDICPAGFAPDEQNLCRLVSLYREYPSLQGRGMGGLKIGLPKVRDGFSPQQIDLGRYLFFDPLLSGNGQVSCATCHQPDKGFGDGLPRSIGAHGEEVPRSAPSLWNVGLQELYFWDGRAESLEQQMQGPLYDELEMANTPQNLLASLGANETYRNLFKQAFPRGELDEISLGQVYLALAAFEASLISLNSRYDYYAHGVHEALSPGEIEGLNIFRSFVARCAECHTPPLFSNQQIAVLGTPEPEGRPLDPGREAVTGDASQRAGFKVPSLRNVSLTAPYMHSGRYENLREAVAFYTGGRGHAVPEGENLSIHWHIWEPQLEDHELDRLVEFLGALTDESYMPATPQQLPSGLPLENSLGLSTDSQKRLARQEN